MFSLSSVIKIYIILSIVVMVSFFIMLTSVDVFLEPIWDILSTDLRNIYQNIYITVIIFSLMTIVFGVFVSAFIFDRGINKYKDFLRRFDNIEQYSLIRPSSIKFPNQDEFGNLGELFNKFIDKMDYYDQLKTNLAKSESDKFKTLSQLFPYPLLTISTNANEPYVSFYNQAFRDLFLKKNVFIDNNGKQQIQYFNLENTPIVNLTYKDQEDEDFLSETQSAQLTRKTILWEKPQKIEELVIKELLGDKKYKFDYIYCIPVNNELENHMMQMIYIYMNPIIVEKAKKTITLDFVDASYDQKEVSDEK